MTLFAACLTFVVSAGRCSAATVQHSLQHRHTTTSTFVTNSSSSSSPVASFYLYYLRPLLPTSPTAPASNPAFLPPPCPTTAVLPATVISRTLHLARNCNSVISVRYTTVDFCLSTFVANSTAHSISTLRPWPRSTSTTLVRCCLLPQQRLLQTLSLLPYSAVLPALL